MQYRVRFETRALKDLRRLDRSQKERIIASIEKMALNLTGDVKKLAAFNPRYRLRVGNFRVLFDIAEDEISIHRIKDRRNAY